MIKYLGSKKKLLPAIVEAAESLNINRDIETVLDLFSGTSRVGHALKRKGFRVIANDINAYAHGLATCYVQSDLEDYEHEVSQLVEEFNRLPGRAGYFTSTFCEGARFFQPQNGERIDAIREAIEAKDLPSELKAIMLVSLMEAADRVDSTTGVQMAYLKRWAPRAFNDIELRPPKRVSRSRFGKCEAYRMDALELVQRMECDLAYIDPPYNQHSYLGNYHVWESLVLWDKADVYGVAQKRIDCRERKSVFNSKPGFKQALATLLQNVRAKYLLVSFNNEGFISEDDLIQLLSARGEVTVLTHDYARYVGAQIGIFNPKGQKVGEVSHLKNKEFLFAVTVGAFKSRDAACAANP